MTRCFRVAQFSLSADTDHPAICQHACELPQTTATVDPLDRVLAILKTLRSLWWVPAVVIPVLCFIDWRESLVKRGWALHAACIADQQKSFMDLRPDVDRFFDSYNSRDLPLDRAEVVWRATIEACSTREAFERRRM